MIGFICSLIQRVRGQRHAEGQEKPAGEGQPGSEPAQQFRRAHEVGNAGEKEHQGDDGRGDQPRHSAGPLVPVDKVGHCLGGHGCHQEKDGHEGADLGGVVQADLTRGGEFIKQSEQKYTQDVIHDRSTEDDLALRTVASAEVGKHPNRNPDTGGRERASEYKRGQQGHLEGVVAEPEAEHEGEDESAQRDRRGFSARLCEAVELRVQAYLEEQQDDADLGEEVQRFRYLDQSQQGGA
jgi:hypothetical protein